jgi:O-antigen/teichoic acid export membrane protein
MFGRLLTFARSPTSRAFAISFAPTALALALQLVTFVLLGRMLGAVNFGLLSAVLALAAVMVEICGLGSGDVLVRGVVTKPKMFSEYFGNAIVLGALSLPVTVIAGFAVSTLGLRLAITPLPLIALLTSEILNSRVSGTVENIFVAHRDVAKGSIVRLATSGSRFLLAVVALGVLHVRSLDTWIWCCFGVSLATSAAFLALAAWAYGRPRLFIAKSELGAGVLFATNQTARAAQSNLDRAFMTAVAVGPIIGAYAAASRVVQLALFPIQIANRILYPRFFAHGAAGGLKATRRFALRCAPMVLALGFGCGLVVAGAAFALPRLMGPDFKSTTPIAVGLAIALPLMSMQYLPVDALTASGRLGLRTALYTGLSVTFSAGLALGAKFFGVWGLVSAFVGGQAVMAIVLWGFLLLVHEAPEEKNEDLSGTGAIVD